MDEPSSTLPSPSSPRMRPSGPRSRRPPNFKPTNSLNISGTSSPPHDDIAPAYSGRTSPALTGSRPQSPLIPSMPSISQLYDAYLNGPSSPKLPSLCEKGVQTTSNDMTPSPGPSRSSTPAVKLIVKPPTLTPPPALNFESTPIQWKGLTLEAAQWSLTSDQLQEIVSRAIRKSAQESFIRLLSVKTLDEELVEELDLLDTSRATTQAQYRFNMHRRTMLLQSLIALSTGDNDPTALANLTTQLAEITVSCDRLMENMLHIADRRAQIQRILDIHDASALAMALRKLNGSYAKRTAELKEARGQIQQLKAELEDAWHVAEDMAQEMDDLDNFHSGFSSDSVGEDEDETEQYNDESVRLAEVINITGVAVATKATLTNITNGNESARGETEMDRASRVSAARKRSTRTSKASLRLPKTSTGPLADRASVFSRRSRTKSVRSRTGTVDEATAPPMPPVHLDTPVKDSFLEMSETRPGSPNSPVSPVSTHPEVPVDVSPHDISPSGSDTEESGSRRPATLNFEIPPIMIQAPDDDDPSQTSKEKNLPSRRVWSMQPTARTRSMDDSDIGNKRPLTDYKKFDGWPWQLGKKTKRHSMPLTRASLDAAKKDVLQRPGSPLNTVFHTPDRSADTLP